MEILANGKLDREAHYAWFQITMLEACMRAVYRKGASANDDIAVGIHNERADWIDQVEQRSNGKLIVKIWKDGTVHIYDRDKYLAHKFGKNWRSKHF